MNKKKLYEQIMKSVSDEVVKAINEMTEPMNKTAMVGDTIRIIRMDDNDGKDRQATRMNGREGVIEHIDSMNQLHGTWGGLAVVPDIDDFVIIKCAE